MRATLIRPGLGAAVGSSASTSACFAGRAYIATATGASVTGPAFGLGLGLGCAGAPSRPRIRTARTTPTPTPSPTQPTAAPFSTSAFRPARHQDHYAVLKLPRNASKAQIKAKFYELSKKMHPDAPGGSAEAFHLINDAYGVLGNDAARATYDRGSGGASRARGGPGGAGAGGFHPHSPQARRAAGPHRAWSGAASANDARAPPGAQWAGRRRHAPDMGWGMGMGGTNPNYNRGFGPESAQKFGKRETETERMRRQRRYGQTRLDEEIKGESGLWRFLVVAVVLIAILGVGGGFTTSAADAGDDDDDDGVRRRRARSIRPPPLD